MSTIKQGLTAIANEVSADAQKEVEAVILNAEKEAKEALAAAKEEAEKTFMAILNEAKAKAEMEKRKIESSAAVEVRNQLLMTKEELVNATFNQALVKLNDFVKSEAYHDYLLNLIKEASSILGVKSMILHVNSKDKAWLPREIGNLSKKLNVEFKLTEKPQDCIGGCRVESSDGRMSYDSTLESRLEQLKPALRGEVAKILFGAEV